MSDNDALLFRVKELENKVEYGFILSLSELLLLVGYSDRGYIRTAALERFLELYGLKTQ